MSLATTIAGAVATAKKVTDSLQVEVGYRAKVSQSGYGSASYGPKIVVKALLEQKAQMVRSSSGEMVQTKATVTFLEPLPGNALAGRTNPVDDDLITLPDGAEWPIVSTSGLVNPDTNAPFFSQVYI